jgi:glutathione peroxidase
LIFKFKLFHLFFSSWIILLKQEPGDSAEEILNSLRFVRPGQDFKPNFQLFSKCDVNGEDQSDLFKYLKSSCSPPIDQYRSITNLIYSPYSSNDIRWNFEKFLISKNGKCVMRIQHEIEPCELEPFIEALLNNENINELKKIANKIENKS